MSWLGTLQNLMSGVGRGAEDLFTLGGTELARKYGGQGAKNVLDPLATGLGSNYAAGAVGGGGILGAQGLGAFGGGAGAGSYGAAGMSAPNMGMAGSTLGPGGMSSSLNPMAASSAGSSAAGPSMVSRLLQAQRMGGGGQTQQGTPASSHIDLIQKLYSLFPHLRPGQQLPPNSANELFTLTGRT